MFKRRLTLMVLTALVLLIGKAEALTLTQKLGNEYIVTSVESGEEVNMTFTSKVGFKFKNWVVSGITGVDTTNPTLNFAIQNQNVVVEGKYIDKYTVTFNGNGGQGSMTNQSIPALGSRKLNANTFTKENHNFIGWAESENGSKLYDDEESITPDKDLDLYALWEVVEKVPIASVQPGAYIKYLLPEGRTVTASASDTGYTKDQTFTPSAYNNTYGWKVWKNNNGQLEIVSAENVLVGGDVANSLVLGRNLGSEWNEITDSNILTALKIGWAKAPYTLNKLCNDGYATGDFAVSGKSAFGGYGDAENLFDYELDGQKIDISYLSHAKIRDLVDAGKIAEDNMYYPYFSISNMDVAMADMELFMAVPELMHTTGNIWMAYRYFGARTDYSYFGVYCLAPDGGRGDGVDFYENSDGRVYGYAVPCGVRPIITLESGLKVIDGEGTFNSPYVLSR